MVSSFLQTSLCLGAGISERFLSPDIYFESCFVNTPPFFLDRRNFMRTHSCTFSHSPGPTTRTFGPGLELKSPALIIINTPTIIEVDLECANTEGCYNR